MTCHPQNLDDIKKTIGRRLGECRRRRGLTQQELATKLGVNASYIGPLEKGIKAPSMAILAEISRVCETPVFTFFVDQKSMVNNYATLAALLACHEPKDQRQLLRMLHALSGVVVTEDGEA